MIKVDFQNYGAEAHWLRGCYVNKKLAILLMGSRYDHGYNFNIQGLVSINKDADFNFIDNNPGPMSFDGRSIYLTLQLKR